MKTATLPPTVAIPTLTNPAFTEEERRNIAWTIRLQFGGNRFCGMTGAKNFIALDAGVQFDLQATLTEGRIYRMHVLLDYGKDTYIVVTYSRRTKEGVPYYFPVECRTDVYAGDLEDVFTSMTGLYTSL